MARLAPLYILVLFGFVVAQSWYANINSANAARLFGRGVDLSFECELFLHNNTIPALGIWPGQWLAPTWSLAVEVQFYLVAPIIMLMTPRSRLPPVLLSIAAAALALSYIIVGSTGSTMAAHLLLPCRADTFVAGALVAVLSLDRSYHDRLAKIVAVARRYSWGIVLTLLSSSTFGFVLYAPQTATVGYSILAVLASALLIGALYSTAGAWNTVLTHPALRFFGTHSFGIYLLHQPVRGLIAIALADEGYMAATSPVLSPLAIAVTMGLAAASWRYFEAPFVNMSRRFPHIDSIAAVRAP